MKLSEIFEQLTYGELFQFSMGGSEGQEIRPENYRRVLSHVNLGLTELHKRFWLRSGQIMVQMYDHISIYQLDERFAQTNTLSTELYKYIMDSVYEPFKNSAYLKTEEIYDENGCKLCLNDLNEQGCSFYTPTYNSIQVPLPYDQSAFSVHYRGNHPTIPYTDGMDPETIEVELPIGLLESLLLFVGGRAQSSSAGDGRQEAMNWMQQFDQSCARAEGLGLEITPQYNNLKLDYRGYV